MREEVGAEHAALDGDGLADIRREGAGGVLGLIPDLTVFEGDAVFATRLGRYRFDASDDFVRLPSARPGWRRPAACE